MMGARLLQEPMIFGKCDGLELLLRNDGVNHREETRRDLEPMFGYDLTDSLGAASG